MGLLKRESPWVKEYRAMWKKEQAFLVDYREERPSVLRDRLAGRVPEGLQQTLDAAFAKAFGLIFEKGQGAIRVLGREKRRQEDYEVNRVLAEAKGSRRNLRAFPRAAGRTGAGNVVLSGVEGVGLGLLGIGIPDVPLFVGTLLKAVYETAASFGYTRDTPSERTFQLRVIEAAMSSGQPLEDRNRALNQYIQTGEWPDTRTAQEQLNATARQLSDALLYQKFLQGVPIVGAAGGFSDAVCMRRVQRYAALKYHRRFLLEHR